MRERFYLWLLLLIVLQLHSFEDLCIVNRVLQSNFKSAFTNGIVVR